MPRNHQIFVCRMAHAYAAEAAESHGKRSAIAPTA